MNVLFTINLFKVNSENIFNFQKQAILHSFRHTPTYVFLLNVYVACEPSIFALVPLYCL